MPNLTFNAIDVETANRRRASICQIGLVQVHMGKIGRALSFLVDPEENFEPVNTGIHGIDESAIRGAITLPDIYPRLRSMIEQAPLVSHSKFDKQALEQAESKYGLTTSNLRWLDTARIARTAWPEKYEKSGWGLKKIANDLGIAFQHHEAGEDARVAAEILLHACRHTGTDVDDWLERAGYKPGGTIPGTSGQTPPIGHGGQAPVEISDSPHLPSWDSTLTRILELEEKRGLDNGSVLGGMDRYIQRWAKAIMEEMGSSGIHRVLLTIPYASLAQEERSWWAAQWRAVIAGRPLGKPRRSAERTLEAEPAASHSTAHANPAENPGAGQETRNTTMNRSTPIMEPTGWMRLLRNDPARDGRIADWQKRQKAVCPDHPGRTPSLHTAGRQLFCSAPPRKYPGRDDAPGICGWRMPIPEDIW